MNTESTKKLMLLVKIQNGIPVNIQVYNGWKEALERDGCFDWLKEQRKGSQTILRQKLCTC